MTELNEKLAVWAGFKWVADRNHTRRSDHVDGYWLVPGTEEHTHPVWNLPDFPNDLNACFKWLVPRFEQVYLKYYTPIGHTAVVFMENWTNRGEGTDKDSMALALCRAIEQVIDGVAQ